MHSQRYVICGDCKINHFPLSKPKLEIFLRTILFPLFLYIQRYESLKHRLNPTSFYLILVAPVYPPARNKYLEKSLIIKDLFLPEINALECIYYIIQINTLATVRLKDLFLVCWSVFRGKSPSCHVWWLQALWQQG